MLNKSFRYSALSVDLVELDPGESFTFQLNPASASYGSLPLVVRAAAMTRPK